MTRMLLDFNPLTGESCTFEYDAHTNQMVLTHEQDVSHVLEYSHARATDGDYSKKGIREDMWHYAHVPNIVIVDMKQRFGVDFYDKNHKGKVIDLINSEYPYCKTTTGVHRERS